MRELSPRLKLPLLVPGQGQKDITHNEAIMLLDALIQPSVIAAAAVPPAQPEMGECWLVAEDSLEEWAGHDNMLALWTQGGWRFVDPGEGARIWMRDTQCHLRRQGNHWVRELAIVANALPIEVPTGGTVIDVEARHAISALLLMMGIGQNGTSSSRSSLDGEGAEERPVDDGLREGVGAP